jgi:hypothetical protein
VSSATGGNWNNWTGPWNSRLKLHGAGLLNYTDAKLLRRGEVGIFWSNTRYSTASGYAIQTESAFNFIAGGRKSQGYSVRCLWEK